MNLEQWKWNSNKIRNKIKSHKNQPNLKTR